MSRRGLQGVTISDCSQVGHDVADGVYVVGGVTHLRIAGCRIGHPIFGGSSPSAGVYQRYGINIAADAATDYVTILGNDLSGNSSIGLNYSTIGSNVVIDHNVGAS
jgi:hypothetical protein